MFSKLHGTVFTAISERSEGVVTTALSAEASCPAPRRGPTAKFREWIYDLPERQREAFLLSREQDLSHEEIAEVMDVSPNTVNNHIVKAMRALRDRLKDFRPDLL